MDFADYRPADITGMGDLSDSKEQKGFKDSRINLFGVGFVVDSGLDLYVPSGWEFSLSSNTFGGD